MPEHLYPGVYIEETGDRGHGIVAAATATAGFVGVARQGPIDTPTAVASLAEYESGFGAISSSQPLSSAVEAFFLNGGKKAVILRAGIAAGKKLRAEDLIGNLEKKTGLYALSQSREPLGLLLVPDAAFLSVKEAAKVTQAAATFSEAQGLFHIFDVPHAVAGQGVEAAAQWASQAELRNRNTAVYYPWLIVGSGSRKKAATAVPRPPSAFAAGLYARTDEIRGVWKAPAGQEAAVLGVTRLAENVTEASAEKLRSVSVNVIRKVAGVGIVLWGARVFGAAADAEWKYVNVRRLALFLKNSIGNGLSWVVFEPSGESLWAQIRLEVSSFLHSAWRAGAFQGARPEEAYFVRCDATTMTADDIANGRVVVTIGFAPMKTAEFVILRIGLSLARTA